MTAQRTSLECDANGTVTYWQRGCYGWKRSRFPLRQVFCPEPLRLTRPVPVPDDPASDRR